MKDALKVEQHDVLPDFCSSVLAMKNSLHARKWATIQKLGSQSTASAGAMTPNPPNDGLQVDDGFGFDPVIDACRNTKQDTPEKLNDIASTSMTDISDYELSSTSKRKLSREPVHELIGSATRGVSEMLAGISGFDLSDTDIDNSKLSDALNSVSYNSEGSHRKSSSEIKTPGFKRRNTRRIAGPLGERIVKNGSDRDVLQGPRCLLEVEPGDQALIGFVEKVLEASHVSNGSSITDNDGQNGTDTVYFGDPSKRDPSFPNPVLSSTMRFSDHDNSEDSLDSSENSPSFSGGSPPEQDCPTFGSTDLPLYPKNCVAPIPRVNDLQTPVQEAGTTTYTDSASEDLYSSNHSSQNDILNSILPPIHSHQVKSTLHHVEEPDFEELERYFPNHQMSLFIGTWNMHSEKDVPLLVEEFLMPPECEFLQDMYVIGTQECTPHKREWEVTVQATLGPTHVLVRSESLGDIHLIILVRREMIWIIRDVQSSTVACGAGGVMRNKGAVGIILTIFGSSMLFITAHLRAHSSKIKERNYDSLRIATSLDFSRYDLNTAPPQPTEMGGEEKLSQDCTDKVDCVFWFGDLNYRVTCSRGFAEEAMQSNNIEPLLEKEQLLQQMKSRAAFRGFTEAPINFPPTFKFDCGSVEYDTSPKQRVPSWTDRILYKSRQDSITPQLYHYCPSLTFSDHRPVFGVYLVTLKPSPISSTIRATGWFDKRAYARAMKRRQSMYPKGNSSTANLQEAQKRKLKEASFVYKAVNKPVKKVMASHKNSFICTVM